jgi:hypothetical protein
MIDKQIRQLTRRTRPVRVETGEDHPLILVGHDQLREVTDLLKQHRIPHTADPTEVFAVIDLGSDVDVAKVQAILDSVP